MKSKGYKEQMKTQDWNKKYTRLVDVQKHFLRKPARKGTCTDLKNDLASQKSRGFIFKGGGGSGIFH